MASDAFGRPGDQACCKWMAITRLITKQTLILPQVIKRVQQLTGHRVRDPVISSATSMSHLYQALKTRPEPEKLAHAKQLRKVNLDLPNVTVHDHRRTPIHKHQEVGRWKVIEEELINRGLPVTGSRWQGAKTTSPII